MRMHPQTDRHRIAILGGGESGVGAALLAQAVGHDVFVSDAGVLGDRARTELEEAGISFEEGGHSPDRILACAEVIKSPGIPHETDIVRTVRAAGLHVISEVEFAARHTDARIVAITGSNGKTTTTALIHHVLRAAGIDAVLAGNIGTSFAREVARCEPDVFVVEVSSFQLDDVHDFKPHIALLLNITPDHLDRYQNDFSLYAAAKFRIGMNQDADDLFLFGADSDAVTDRLDRFPLGGRRIPFGATAARDGDGGHLTNDTLHIRFKKKTSPCLSSISA